MSVKRGLAAVGLFFLSLSACKDRGEESVDLGTDTVVAVASRLAELPASSMVSYADAGWLEHQDETERADQVADWAVFGLAALLQMDAEALRDHYYDKTPVRDAFFADVTTNPVGPGRSLPDGSGTLHLLVPRRDPYEARTVGLLLDEYRKDAGADPERVRVHRYRDDRDARTVRLDFGAPEAAPQVRTRSGYVEQSIATAEQVAAFLSRTQHLSRLELRGGEVWAAGWNWPSVPAGRITMQDLAVLQRGYQGAALGTSTEPGFSLDPGEPVRDTAVAARLLRQARHANASEVLGAVGEAYELYPEEASGEREWLLGMIEEEYGEVVKLAQSVYEGGTFYQYARYDGGLQGTEAGMTYFYTDLVAKAWPMERGAGSPAGRVPGFVSDVKAQTPWGHCEVANESGRLWFGLREEGVSIYESEVEFGSLATRLFSLIDDPAAQDREIEPSYSFGRVMWWWDRNYVRMADYEPQYHRLDQLMRWGAAIGWLVENSVVLPVPSSASQPAATFAQWLSAHPELKWKYDVPFVRPAGVTTEALTTLYSDGFEDCGRGGIWSGGISNPSREVLRELRTTRPALEARLARGGMQADYTSYTASTRAGTIGNATVQRNLQPVQGNAAQVAVTAQGRKVWSFSQLKASVAETAQRRLNLSLSASPGRISQRMQVQGHDLGELSAIVRGQSVTVQWKPSLLDRTRRALGAVQRALGRGRSLNEAVAAVPDVRLAYTDDAGRVHLRVDAGRESRWVAVEEGVAAAGDELAFRMGAPAAEPGADPRWFSATFHDGPPLSAPAGSSGGWMQVQGGGGGPSRVSAGSPPGGNSRAYMAEYPDGRGGRVYVEGDRVKAAIDDPVFGVRGTHDGAVLMQAAVLRRVEAAARAGRGSRDGYARLVALPDETVALVQGDHILLVEPASAWHQRVRTALAGGDDGGRTLARVDNNRLLLAHDLGAGSGRTGGSGDLADVLAYLRDVRSGKTPQGPPVAVDQRLATAALEGQLPPDPVGAGWQVRIVEVDARHAAIMGSTTPDRLLWNQTQLVPVGLGGRGPAPAFRTVRLLYPADCDEDDPARRCEG